MQKLNYLIALDQKLLTRGHLLHIRFDKSSKTSLKIDFPAHPLCDQSNRLRSRAVASRHFSSIHQQKSHNDSCLEPSLICPWIQNYDRALYAIICLTSMLFWNSWLSQWFAMNAQSSTDSHKRIAFFCFDKFASDIGKLHRASYALSFSLFKRRRWARNISVR